jgi:glyoxylase-like metal-dependent hydrolase (beta-lactamase superfamily II)
LVDIKEIAENIYLIDDQLYSIPGWGSVYLVNEEKKALIDTGPAASVGVVLDGMKRVGVKAGDIDYIVVTHVHLDHSGGAGVLVRKMPRAQVLVHHRGAKHLVNPAKLISSTLEVQGEEALLKHGEVVPIDGGRVKPVYDGDTLKLGGRQVLRFIDAPGHAWHELCIYESRNNGIFVGDAAGISLAESGILLPDTPPPGFDAELSIDTLEKLMGLKATLIYFAHFGAREQAEKNLSLARGTLQAWGEMVSRAVEEGGFDTARERIMAQVLAQLKPIKKKEALYKWITEITLPLSIAGYLKYYQEKHELIRRGSEGN